MKKVIFVYGFTGTNKDSETAKKVLNNYDVICFEYDSGLKKPLEKIADELDDFIISKTNTNEKVNLIGVSAGGVIASYYTRFVSPNKVDKLATICSPFKGTYVPIFYSKKRKGLNELFYGSEFLKKLNSRKLNNKAISFYSYFDLLVPGNSGKAENPHYTWDFFHFTIQKNKRILKKIKEFFER
ncbi:MAG: alpha/beta fold hydrolase [Nanoarchaeota archaeon]